MIVSASYKTDIPAFYGDWFMARLDAGFAAQANPYGGPPSRVSLAPADVDGFVFWTRNAGPFRAHLDQVARRGFPFVVQITITGYPRALDAATVAAQAAVAQARELAAAFGRHAVVWRYDPVVFSSLTPAGWHRRAFARLAGDLAGAVDEVVLSVMQPYRKTARNMDRAAAAHGFDWWDPAADEKRALLADLTAVARDHGMRATLCDQPELRVDGLGEARCVDAERLGQVAGRPLDVPRKPHRPTCGCWASRDIGAYDSCPQGCAYCYAVASPAAAKRRLAAHDPAGEFLVAPPGGGGT
ncbi:MAG: DUF1848 domain-containing protein [Hyphomicrobiales bacterium]|nr:DUF1848 domain-containing protein [Hyphomicrobiales bacterium]